MEISTSIRMLAGGRVLHGFIFLILGVLLLQPSVLPARAKPGAKAPPLESNPLKPPAQGSIPVAFLVSDGAVVIDFCGPWEVFQDVSIPGRTDGAFRLYTVAETSKPVETSGGMKIIPEYTLETAPEPKIIVIPAQGTQSKAVLEWIRRSTKNTDVTM